MTDPSPAIDTTDDLVRSELQVYGTPHHKQMIVQEDIRSRYHFVNIFDECATERLRKGDRVACIHYGGHIKAIL